jgi:hypothetical protein
MTLSAAGSFAEYSRARHPRWKAKRGRRPRPQGLAFRHPISYSDSMIDPTKRPLTDILADLDASDAEVVAGDVVAAEVVFADLETRLARLEGTELHSIVTPATSRH